MKQQDNGTDDLAIIDDIDADDFEPGGDPDADATPERELYRVALTYQAVQRTRLALQASFRARPALSSKARSILDRATELEKSIVAYMAEEMKTHPAGAFMAETKGVGPRLGGMVLGLVDIHKAPTVSALWKYAGLAVVDGKSDRRKKGQKISFNMALKKTMYLIGGSFLKCKSQPYEQIYRDARIAYKTRVDAEGKAWTDGHCHLAAMRKMEKVFLAHLWEHWRLAEGLPIRPPYSAEYLGHVPYIQPQVPAPTNGGAA